MMENFGPCFHMYSSVLNFAIVLKDRISSIIVADVITN